MKRASQFITLFVLLTTIAFSQKSKDQGIIAPPKMPVSEETKLITYEKVVEITGSDKNTLFTKALEWANQFYKNPTDVIREKDANAGQIVCKARFKIYNQPDKKEVVTDAGDVMYTMTLNFKDGRYRCEITKINWQQISAFPIERWQDSKATGYRPEYSYYLKQTDEKVKEVMAELEKFMRAAPKAKKEW